MSDSVRLHRQQPTRLPHHFHALEKEMATHSHVLAWRMPPKGPLNKLGPLPISPFKFRLISYIFKEGFLIQRVRSSHFALELTHTHKHTRVLHNAYYILE